MRISKAQAKLFGIDTTPNGKLNHAKNRRKRAGKPSTAAEMFDRLCEAHGLPLADHEYPFAASIGRKWRFDHLWEGWLALEVQGGLFVNGGHNRGAYMLEEYEKYNNAVLMGYSMMFCAPSQIEDGSIFPVIAEALGCEAEQS